MPTPIPDIEDLNGLRNMIVDLGRKLGYVEYSEDEGWMTKEESRVALERWSENMKRSGAELRKLFKPKK